MPTNMEIFKERRSGEKLNRPGDTRDQYVRDRARMIHSASFRRLQAKTQVLGIGESDFYRTRLTHSLEVAQIGSGIVKHLRKTGKKRDESWVNYLPQESLIETICLAHDLGHPPFGHGGEIALNYMMRNHGGFEGNGQTLRIIARLDKYTEKHGMDLTRRSMLGVIKYPVMYSNVCSIVHKNVEYLESKKNHREIKANECKPPKCIFDDDKEILDWIFSPFEGDDIKIFTSITEIDDPKTHHKSKYKSFDTTIMDLADDIAYGIHDLEDAISLQLIDKSLWDSEVLPKLLTSGSSFGGVDIILTSEELFSKETYMRKHAIGSLVNWLITSIKIKKRSKFNHPLFRFEAYLKEEDDIALEIIKKLVINKVIKSAEVQMLEYKGQQIIMRIFEALSSDPGRLLPESAKKQWQIAAENGTAHQMRAISDFISGMTDDFATRIYQSLFVADSGSIFNKL